MNITIYILPYFGIGFIAGLINVLIAKFKNRDCYCWFLLGILFNLPSLFVLLFLSSLRSDSYTNTQQEAASYRQDKSRIRQRLAYASYALFTLLILYFLFGLLHNFIR